jgi:hypothetical protein
MKTGVGEIDPDIYVPVSFKDYFSGRDLAFEACLNNFYNQSKISE